MYASVRAATSGHSHGHSATKTATATPCERGSKPEKHDHCQREKRQRTKAPRGDGVDDAELRGEEPTEETRGDLQERWMFGIGRKCRVDPVPRRVQEPRKRSIAGVE